MTGGKGSAFAPVLFNGMSSFISGDVLDLEKDSERAINSPNRAAFTQSLVRFLKKRATGGMVTIPRNQDVLQLMYQGDYWQGGAQWMGPLPEDLPEEIRYEIARYFASRNMIKECVDRHFDAIVGEDPRINTNVRRALKTTKQKNETTGVEEVVREKPKDDEQSRMEEYDASLTNWYDSRDIFTPFIEGLPSLLTRGSSLYRLYIPYYLMESADKLPAAETMDEALDLIRLMPVEPGNGRMVKTSAGDIVGGWYTYQEGNTRVTEIHYVDLDTNETVISTNVRQGSVGANDWNEIRLELGGKLLMVELSRRYPFVTPQAMQLSNLLNVDFTVLGRNLTQAGFLERIITNAQMPGKMVDKLDPDTGEVIGQTFVPEPFYVGTGTTNVLSGVEMVDENGEGTGKRADPKVYYRDPVPVTTFQDTDDMLRQAIYAEFKQGHMMISSSSTTTGRSREQALNDFSASIRFSARIINRGLSQIFDTAMAIAAWICDDEEYSNNYKTVVTTRLSLKLLTPDEKRVIMEMYDRELMSAETAILEMGHVSDPEAEFALIDAEAPRRDALLMRQVKAGASFEMANGNNSANPNDKGGGSKQSNSNKSNPKAVGGGNKNKPTSDNGVTTS